jgi:hypothetical protein
MGRGWGAGGARARLGRTGPGWVTPRVETSRHAQAQIERSIHEPKSETGRDEHTTKHDIRQRNVLRHDATLMSS